MSVEKEFEEALHLYEKKQYDSAEKKIDSLLQVKPDFAHAWFLKGVVLDETGRSAAAEPCFERSGNRFTMYLRLALQLSERNDERALAYFDKVAGHDPRNNLVWFSKGTLYERTGRQDLARSCFRNLSPAREIVSRIVIPLGFMLFLVIAAVMMVLHGEKTIVWFVVLSAVICLFWLRRDAGPAWEMLKKKRASAQK